jgi:hypothetical protein
VVLIKIAHVGIRTCFGVNIGILLEELFFLIGGGAGFVPAVLRRLFIHGKQASHVDWKGPLNPVQAHTEMIGRHAEYGRLQALAVDFARRPEKQNRLTNYAQRISRRLSVIRRFARFFK